MRITTRALLLALIAVGLAACATGEKSTDPGGPKYNAMQVKLADVCATLTQTMQTFAERVTTETDDLELKRRMVHAKIVTHTACRRAQIHPNPFVAFLDLWVWVAQRREYLEIAGDAILGPYKADALQANEETLAYVERIAASMIKPDVFEETKAEVRRYAAENPLQSYMQEWRNDDSDAPRGESILKSVTKLAPSLGIKRTATSIKDVAHSIDGIADVVSDVPLLARWNATLLLYETQRDPTLNTIRDSVESIAATADRFAAIADDYPAKIQVEVSKTLDEIDTKQAGVQQTLDGAKAVATEAKDAVAELRATVKEAETTIASVEVMAENFARAGEAWQPIFGDLLKITGPAPEEPGPPGPDPDIENLVRLSQEARGMATELGGALKDVRGILEGEDIDRIGGTAEGTVDHATDRLAGLVDHVTWRAIQLVLVIAVVAFAYRLLAARFGRPSGA